MIQVFLTSIPWKISILRSPWTGSCNWLQCCDAFSSETEYWIKGGVLLWRTSSPPLALSRFTVKWLRISACYIWHHTSPLLGPSALPDATRKHQTANIHPWCHIILKNYNPNLYLHTETQMARQWFSLNISVWDTVRKETVLCTANFYMLSLNM